MIPMVMGIRIIEKARRKLRLFFPIILVWILLFTILIAFFPLVLIAALILWPGGQGRLLLAGYFMLFSLIFSLSGLHIQVEDRENQTLIFFR